MNCFKVLLDADSGRISKALFSFHVAFNTVINVTGKNFSVFHGGIALESNLLQEALKYRYGIYSFTKFICKN